MQSKSGAKIKVFGFVNQLPVVSLSFSVHILNCEFLLQDLPKELTPGDMSTISKVSVHGEREC
jgi:hypothetical protein